MKDFDRRTFLGVSLAAVAASALPARAQSTPVLRWWDHFGALQRFHPEFAKAFSEKTGIPTEFTYYEVAKLGQALTLAKQSNQMPDIHTTAGIDFPPAALVAEGWFLPIELSKEAMDKIGDKIVEGVHSFGGKPYSFPLFSPRQYTAAMWFNNTMAADAGFDPANPPRSYEAIRTACATLKKNRPGTFGYTVALGNPGRSGEHINDLAQAAGFQGLNGMRFSDGAFAYDDPAYLEAFEFFIALNKDGHMVPGSETYSVSSARARWATGVSAFFVDGPWCAGGVANNLSEFTDKMDVGAIPTPDGGAASLYRAPAGPVFFLSSQSKNPAGANQLLSEFTSDAYYAGLARNMDQPPADLSAVVGNEAVHPAYRRIVGYFEESVFHAPTPILRNGDIAKVQAEAKPVNPPIGTILQGVLTGQITDLKGTLAQLNSASEQDRERSMAAAVAKGAKVSMDDYAFADWKPGKDYILS